MQVERFRHPGHSTLPEVIWTLPRLDQFKIDPRLIIQLQRGGLGLFFGCVDVSVVIAVRPVGGEATKTVSSQEGEGCCDPYSSDR